VYGESVDGVAVNARICVLLLPPVVPPSGARSARHQIRPGICGHSAEAAVPPDTVEAGGAVAAPAAIGTAANASTPTADAITAVAM
jgi:hypothetical protein